ncbi:enoyl-CoA hydratase/isomerase family protein [Psychrosphaera sp.]|nr:enoyl-CoA hydratase/isomerase family protein [Psychrosphaera sp.]
MNSNAIENVQAVLSSIDERGVATVTLNRPEKHNAFDDAVISDLTAAFQAIEQNSEARVLVLASNGKSFSAGADLAWMKRMAGYSYEENLQDAKALAEMLRVLNFMSIPTIAKVQGAAFGGAVGLVACCDMAVASDRASFCLSEVKLGLIPATISPYVVDAIGARASRRYFQTAERFSAEAAKQLNLVSEVTSLEQLDDQVEAMIGALISNGPVAMKAAKKLVFDVQNFDASSQGLEQGAALIDDTSQRIAAIRVSEEGQEGLTAFFDKRSANWTQSTPSDKG